MVLTGGAGTIGSTLADQLVECGVQEIFVLDNFVFVEDLLGPGPAPADYLVLHRDLRREYDMTTVPILLELADEEHQDIGPLVERCRSRFGAPDCEDEWLVVFKLR